MSHSILVTREGLYEEVWAEPMTRVAARYKVSSSFLARVCARLNVPRPPRGYWAQLKVGKAPKRLALPGPRPGDDLEWSRGDETRSSPRRLPKAPEKGGRQSRGLEDKPSRHPLLVGAAQYFETARESDIGYLRPSKKLLIDLFVSKGTLSRALDEANALFLLLEHRGHRVVFAPRDEYYLRPVLDERERPGRQSYSATWCPWRPTVVFIGTVAIGLTLFELSEEVEVRWEDGKYVPVSKISEVKGRRRSSAYSWTTTRDIPSGRLCLRAFSPYPRATWGRQWPESKVGELPGKLRAIARELELEAPTIAKLVEQEEIQAEQERQRLEEQQREWRAEEAEERRVQEIKESKEDLFSIIEAWGLAKRIEGFFEDVEQRSMNLPDNERAVLLERLTRARELLGGIDALQRFRSWKAPEVE